MFQSNKKMSTHAENKSHKLKNNLIIIFKILVARYIHFSHYFHYVYSYQTSVRLYSLCEVESNETSFMLFWVQKKVELDYDLLETFRRMKVNITLLDVIKKISKYTKFLKDLYTHKRELKGNKQVKMDINISALIQSKIVTAIAP